MNRLISGGRKETIICHDGEKYQVYRRRSLPGVQARERESQTMSDACTEPGRSEQNQKRNMLGVEVHRPVWPDRNYVN